MIHLWNKATAPRLGKIWTIHTMEPRGEHFVVHMEIIVDQCCLDLVSSNQHMEIAVQSTFWCLTVQTADESQLPKGATLLGTILSSDKTNISAMTSDHVAHPLLIGIANIKMLTHLKLSSNSFMLTALLLVPKFIHEKKHMRGILEDRLIHQCLDIVLKSVKTVACLGIMMSDPDSHNHYCLTPLAGYIMDTPEAAMLATVGGKTSLVTMAIYKQFSDPFQHEPCTGSMTLAQLCIVKLRADPQDIEAFFWEAQKLRAILEEHSLVVP